MALGRVHGLPMRQAMIALWRKRRGLIALPGSSRVFTLRCTVPADQVG
jgi:hypothetical protein